MEGYPLNHLNNLDNFSYVNEPLSLDQGHMIEDLNANVSPDLEKEKKEDIRNIVSQIGHDLYTNMQGSFKDPPDPEDDGVVKHLKLITEGNQVIQTLHSEFKKSLERVCSSEERLSQAYTKTQKSLDTVRKFSTFLNSLETKEHEELQMMMVVLSEKIRDEDTLQEMKDAYQKELYILQNYLYKFLKPLNAGNMGNTCSLCLQKPVDTFMNPCGHTGCAECIQRLRDMPRENYNTRCFMCRKSVNSFHKLYFC